MRTSLTGLEVTLDTTEKWETSGRLGSAAEVAPAAQNETNRVYRVNNAAVRSSEEPDLLLVCYWESRLRR